MIDPAARIHPSADIEERVSVGPGTAIWQRAQVRAGAVLGAECVVGRDAFIDVDVVIGDRVKIQNGALLYHGLTVEDGVFIGPGAILTNDRHPRAVTTSGELASAADWTVSPVVLRRGSSIGAGAIVVAGTEIGAYALVAAGAVVTRDVSSHALVAGNPARRIGWACVCGATLVDSSGHRAPAEVERYARDPELTCAQCERRFVYVPDGETLEERIRPRQGAPA